MANFRLPNITSTTTEGQLKQVKNYLYQLTNQLNHALKSADDMEKQQGYSLDNVNGGTGEQTDIQKAQETFFTVKNLIIKSADIVNAYYEVINQRLSGQYVAESDYGTFKQETEAFISQTSTNLTQYYSSIQQIESDLRNINELRKDSCYIKTGWLDDEETIAGVEIGKVSETEDGTKDVAFARFTTEELAFYDQNGTKLAWFAKYKLHIKDAVIEGNLWLGGYKLDTTDGIAFLWEADDGEDDT